MADIAISGPALKKMLAMAKKRDLAFAYCPGGKPADDVFALDRNRKPEVMGRTARAEGEGSKLTYGRAELSGKLLTLSCERVLPGAAKRLKRWLRDEKCPLNVRVLDAEGNVVEEDIEDLPDEDFLSDAEAEVDAEMAGDEAPAQDLAGSKARAAAMQSAIQNAPGHAQKPMLKAFKGALAALKAGDAAAATDTLDMLDQALAKLTNDPAAQPGAKGDPRQIRLNAVAEQLMQRIEALPSGPSVDKLRAAYDVLIGQTAAGDFAKAAATAKALDGALTKLN